MMVNQAYPSPPIRSGEGGVGKEVGMLNKLEAVKKVYWYYCHVMVMIQDDSDSLVIW